MITNTAPNWTRVDTVLALLDGVLERLGRAEQCLAAGDPHPVPGHVAKAQLIIVELAAGVRLEPFPEHGSNLLRLYEYAANQCREPDAARIQSAKSVLATLREGYLAIREDAVILERSGQVPSPDNAQIVQLLG